MKIVVVLLSLSCCLYTANPAVIPQSECVLPPQNKINLHDMSVECLLQILEKLKYRDLLEIAQTSHFYEMLARDVFRRKMSSKLMAIAAPFTKGVEHPIIESSTGITLENYEFTRQSLQIFGDEIKKIELIFRSLAPEFQYKIHQLLNKYSSKSLTSLILNKCDENTLAYFTTPFERVESLTIFGVLKSVENGRKLNQIFPALRQLSMYYIDILDSNVLNVTFPHLTQFTLTISFMNDIYSHIEEFVKRNPQIEDLTLMYCNSFDYIKLASEHLPQLQRLQLNMEILGDEYSGPKIHFGSVKTLKMNWGNYDFSDVLAFDQLESLEITSFGDGFNFATQFKNLTKLQLIQRELDNDDILSISEKLPNLKELSISSLSDIEQYTIFQLIERCEKLEKFKLKLSDGNHFEALNNRFRDRWTVTMDGIEISMGKILDKYYRF